MDEVRYKDTSSHNSEAKGNKETLLHDNQT